MIHNPIQLVADDVMFNLDQLCFTRPPTPETMLTVNKYDIQGLVFIRKIIILLYIICKYKVQDLFHVYLNKCEFHFSRLQNK